MFQDFMSSLVLEIELFHYERLRWIAREDLSDVAQKLHQEHPDWDEAYLASGLENLRRYYSLSVLDPLNFHAVPLPLDPFWHTHILFSRDYAAFCRKVFGQFIEHQPLLETEPVMVRFVEELYGYTLGLQPKIFRSVDANWWPPLTAARPICYHMETADALIRERALFPTRIYKALPRI